MKSNVIDMNTRKSIDFENTRVYGARFNPTHLENLENLKRFKESYSNCYKVDVGDVNMCIFMYNGNSSKQFVQEQVIMSLKAIQEISGNE